VADIDTENLTEEQRLIVRNMLAEEAGSFSKTDDDVGRAEELQVDINPTDSVPVQRKYTAILRPLYAEVKQYVEDVKSWLDPKVKVSLFISGCMCSQKNKSGSKQTCPTVLFSWFLFVSRPRGRLVSTYHVTDCVGMG